MNNQIPYFMNGQPPILNNQPLNNNPQVELEKLLNKINRLEKNIRILENRVAKLEINSSNNYLNDDPTDMYII